MESVKNMCLILIQAGRTEGLKEDMSALLLAKMLTRADFTELCSMIGGQN